MPDRAPPEKTYPPLSITPGSPKGDLRGLPPLIHWSQDGTAGVRIVHLVCTDAFAGTEQYIAYTSRQQAADGHAVTVLGGSGPEMTAAIGRTDVAWRPATTIWAAQRALLRSRADVIHVHLTAAEIAAVSTKPIHRRPIVSTIHLAVPRGGGRRRRHLYRLLPRFIDAQVAISHFVADRSGADCEVIPNGVPWDLGEHSRSPIVLMAQRLEPEKDTATALRAWAESGLGGDGWRLEIAGDGSQRPALAALTVELGISGSVAFLGFVDDVKARMAGAGMFLATTPEDGLGLSVIEAMAAATPVVAAAGGGHLETVGRSGRDGLFEPGSAQDCARTLRRFAMDDDTRRAYGDRLRGVWAGSFTLPRHTAQLEAVYRRVLAGKR